jgi:ribose 5-phosphate isomerase B
MKIAIGSDHAGLNLKRAIKRLLADEGHEVVDFGTDSDEAVDYPDFAFPVAEAVARREVDLGIFPCGSGLGPCIAANKVPGIRAVTCHDVYSARSARRDNDANLLTMGERVIGIGVALEVVKAWVTEPYTGVERHQRRIDKITSAEGRYCRADAIGNED